MAHELDMKAKELTAQTGYYHFADFDDVAQQMRIIPTAYKADEEPFSYIPTAEQEAQAAAVLRTMI